MIRHSRNDCLPRLRHIFSIAIAFIWFAPGMASAQQGTSAAAGKFFLGADVSALDAPTRFELPPYQEGGKAGDEVSILMRHGWTAFRVRVFVSPVRSAPNNTLENAIPLCKQIKAAGAMLILDLHFSDTWADPQHQDIPVAWRGMNIRQLQKQWQKYAYDTVKALKDAGAMPDMVAVGNEITRGAAWPLGQLMEPGSEEYNPPASYDDAKQWAAMTGLLKAGIRGAKSAAGGAPVRIAIHIDKGGHWDTTEWYFDHLRTAHVHYDVIAQSFYPIWAHGTLDDLWKNMNECARRYRKDFLVMETGYIPSRVANNNDMFWPVTPEGRLQFMVDLVNTVKKAPRGIGVLYWAPERDLWNADGSPGPAVFTLDNLTTLTVRPESKAPAAVEP
jgi:arabinogalactan endo-1,4-beta-galactosidase